VVENIHLDDSDSDHHNDEETPLTEEVETKEETVEPSDELAALRQRLEEEQAKAAEYLDGWQRARAELANARKRWERESAQTYTNALADSAARLLLVIDDFERAIMTMPSNLSGLTWIEGILLIYRKLQTVLHPDRDASYREIVKEQKLWVESLALISAPPTRCAPSWKAANQR